ncbi:MAG: S41 family peptidase [Planctomycetales bacterium]
MPSLRCLRCAVFFVLAGLGGALAFSPGFAGSASAPPPSQTVIQAVNSGVELERSRKWLDAFQHYEKAAKSWPDSKELEIGLRRSKFHYYIERRYTDGSFRKSLLPMTRQEAMSLLDQVLSYLESTYVEAVHPMSFVAHGTESFYLALGDDRFLDANTNPRLRGNAEAVREILKGKQFWNKPVSNREEAHALIDRICQLSGEQLGIKPAAVILEYVFGGCNVLDDYSAFLTPGRLHDLHSNIDGQFVGLGVEVRAEAGQGLLLVHVLPESPASEAGLQSGEHIVNIDGVDVRQMTTDESASRLQGTEGSRVVLEVQKSNGGSVRRVSVTRRAVVVKSVPVAKIVDRDQGIGYIQMTSFQKSTVEEFDAALQTLRQQGMRSLIWDLRGNPGGLLTTAVEVLDRFIGDGVLVSGRGRIANRNFSYSAHRPGTWNIPLVLLIDGDSASASEIVAGAVKDHHRGTIVGRKSFGKWSVQEIHNIPTARGMCGLRMTTAKFYSPHGHTLGKIGLHPDIEVPESEAQRTTSRGPADLEQDADVQKAREVLQRQMARR